MAVPVQFDDLHKIRSPLGNVEGLDLSIYDNMIEVSCTCLCLLSEMLVSLYYSDDGSYVMNNGYLSIIHGASNTQSMLFLILLQGGFKGNGVSPIKINRKKTNRDSSYSHVVIQNFLLVVRKCRLTRSVFIDS